MARRLGAPDPSLPRDVWAQSFPMFLCSLKNYFQQAFYVVLKVLRPDQPDNNLGPGNIVFSSE